MDLFPLWLKKECMQMIQSLENAEKARSQNKTDPSIISTPKDTSYALPFYCAWSLQASIELLLLMDLPCFPCFSRAGVSPGSCEAQHTAHTAPLLLSLGRALGCSWLPLSYTCMILSL